MTKRKISYCWGELFEILERRLMASVDVAPFSSGVAAAARVMGPFAPPVSNVAVAARVVSESGVIAGDIANTLEVDPWTNAATVTLPATFEIALGREVDIRALQFVWGSASNVGVSYTVQAVDFDGAGGVYATVAEVSGATGQVQYTPVNGGSVSAAFLRVTVTQASTSEPLVLQQLSVMATQPTAIQAILLNPANQDVLYSGSDPANPLSVFGFSITKGMALVGDEILEDAAEAQGVDASVLSDHQKIVAFMDFLNGARIGDPSAGNPEASLLENIGACGNWSDIVAAWATTQGIQARLVDLFNYPFDPTTGTFNGHTVTEMYINNEWEMYDPTYGEFYTIDPGNTVNPHVLSFEDLKAGGGFDADVTRVVGDTERLAEGGAAAEAFAGPAIYGAANPSGVVGPGNPMLFPMALDLNTKPVMTGTAISTTQGAYILGSADVNVSQQFTLTGLTAGQTYGLTATYSGWGGGSAAISATEFDAFSTISGGTMIGGGNYAYTLGGENTPWAIQFVAGGTTATIVLSHTYDYAFYLYAQSYAVSLV